MTAGVVTPRQRDVIRELAAGYGRKEIAVRLGLSHHTVRAYTAAIKRRVNAPTLTRIPAVYYELTGDDPWPR